MTDITQDVRPTPAQEQAIPKTFIQTPEDLQETEERVVI